MTPPAPTTSGPAGAPAEVFHQLSVTATLDQLGSGLEGLPADEARRRLDERGRNELVEGGSAGPLRLLWEQLTAVMVLILIGAAVLSLLLGKVLEASAIGSIVVLFALLGFVQEYRAERAIAALRRLAVPTVRVVRGGQTVEVPAVDLVPGDIVALEAGNVVPADVRLIESAGLRVQEAALTGESEPVDKTTEPMPAGDLALGDRRNMAYSGTQVSFGRGRGVVTATGMSTELGRIASLLSDVKTDQTPLQERLDLVGKQLALAGVVVAGLVVAIGAAAGESFSDLVLTAISVAVAVIPEGLPAVVTFTLAIGAQRMLRRNALVRKLPAVETLGSVTVICSDKTGTLTQNRMTATVVDVAGATVSLTSGEEVPDAVRLTLAVGALCNDAEARVEHGELLLIGDPTETAIVAAAHEQGVDVDALRAAVVRLAERPFDSERKRMSTTHAALGSGATSGRAESGSVPVALQGLPRGDGLSFVKGAVDGLLAHTVGVWDGEAAAPFDDAWRDRVLAANDSMARNGMRVLGVAFRTLADPLDTTRAEDHLTLLGLIGIIDPPRAEVRDAVSTCTTAGVRTVMITGDHPLTAQAIATDLGIGGDGPISALTGTDLDRLDDVEFRRAVTTTSVFARVSPEHKLRIVDALQSHGEVVAMTGDGVNDAPALKRSDIGVAMGITGTDVSKEASDMVLRDDNFTTIVAAVEEGRVIYDNLRRFVKFAVAGNVGKILVMLAWPVPTLLTGGEIEHAVALLPLQLLWLNLMTDGLLGLSMGVEPAERGVMTRPPHTPGSSIWAGGLGAQAAWVGVVIGVVPLVLGWTYEALDRDTWQSMIFTSLAFLQIFQALGSRTATESLRSVGLRSNPVMLGIIGLVVALQMVAIYTPLNGFLDLEPLGVWDLSLCIGVGALLLAGLETHKWALRSVTARAGSSGRPWSPR